MGALHPILIVIAAGTLVCVFARAVVHKATDFSWFVHTLSGYKLLPASLSAPVAAVMLALEVLVVIGLVVPQTRAPAALLSLALLVLYGVAIAANLLRGNRRIDCGCGGAGQGLSWFLVARNVVLGGFSVVAMASPLPVEMGFASWASAAAGILSFLLLLAGVEKLIENWSWLAAANESHAGHGHEGHHHEGHH